MKFPASGTACFPLKVPAGSSTGREFDRLMVQAAKAAGVDTRFGSAVGSAVRDDQGWLLKLADEAIVARAVVWATGRSWRLARCFGAKLTMHGHLAAYTRFFDRAPGDCSMVERRLARASPIRIWAANCAKPDIGTKL
ncbi:hypothetical protein X739_33045 [Mesorhizobium sp. LNHC220B00]|nr:hypothetical protein [Mesorhizobium sp. LNHC220B00]ESY77318.1 hypothetical protein X739_33045 [Mesorhizobium sp. LNHC220B00]